MDKIEDIIKIAKAYADYVKKIDLPLTIDSAYLFGSFAKGTPHKDSDIDIAFIVSNWTGDYFETVVPIWSMCDKFDLRIEPHIIVPEEDYTDFGKEVQRTGILI